MAAPSAPIDSDLSPYSNDVYYVLEQDGIWKTENLTTAGAATWSQVWSDSDFDGSEFGALLRLRCAYGQESLVYAIGWGYDDGTPKVFCLKSQNAGATWVQNWVAEIDDPGDGTINYLGVYTETGGSPGQSLSASVKNGIIDLMAGVPCQNPYDEDDCNQFPNVTKSAIIELVPPVDEASGIYVLMEFDISGVWPSRDYDSDGDAYPWCEQFVAASTYANVYTGSHASRNVDLRYNDRKLFYLGWEFGHPGRGEECSASPPCEGGGVATFGQISNLEVDGVSYDGDYPAKGFDVARTNSDWLYVGLLDKIMKSEDGGYEWTELTTDHGAHDICVDPQAAGAIYYFDTAGDLRLRVAGVDQGVLYSDSALVGFGRIARDPSSGKLWIIDTLGYLKKRESGLWTSQKSGLTGGRGLRAYLSGKVICMDALDIYLSSDSGENWSEKKGGWSDDFTNPVWVHLMKDET